MKIQLSAFSTKGPRKINQDRYCIININYEINRTKCNTNSTKSRIKRYISTN